MARAMSNLRSIAARLHQRFATATNTRAAVTWQCVQARGTQGKYELPKNQQPCQILSAVRKHALGAMEDKNQKLRARPVAVNVLHAYVTINGKRWNIRSFVLIRLPSGRLLARAQNLRSCISQYSLLARD